MDSANYNTIYKYLSYMVNEIVCNMQRIILETEPENKYAIKKVITPNFDIKIAIYNTENDKGTYKQLSAIEFSKICSDVVGMESYFTKLANDMLEAIQ